MHTWCAAGRHAEAASLYAWASHSLEQLQLLSETVTLNIHAADLIRENKYGKCNQGEQIWKPSPDHVLS